MIVSIDNIAFRPLFFSRMPIFINDFIKDTLGGVKESSLGTSTNCCGTRYHAKTIKWYHSRVFGREAPRTFFQVVPRFQG